MIIMIINLFHVYKERLKLHSYTGKIAHFSFTCGKVNKTDSLHAPFATGRLCKENSLATYNGLTAHALRLIGRKCQ